ncbi:lipase family protein [Streptomyces sp. DH-12]|uniref:alpha/beta fold hydrolase n=1 Tax=Streptomyces sp. DH-12 TaxID=2072509 RepID=UPI001F53AD64|nr:lipase family protein [Streptomyces sp. DH-12]
MARIVGVHGIRQSRTSKEQLTNDWSRALNRGLGELGRPDLSADALELPHWTGLLARGANHLGPEEDRFDVAVPLSEEEVDFAATALEEVVRQEDLARVQQLELQTLGLPQLWPARLTRLVMAYDRRFPRGGGKLFVSMMREVRFYLYEPDLAAHVRALVAESFSGSTAVVIGHSLGSVIAYDLLRRGEIAPDRSSGVRTLVTCGSPLTIPSVRRGLNVTDGEPLKLPGDIAWVNVFDPGDFITGGTGLSALSPEITDAEVDNGIGNPHSALRYLRSTQVADVIAESCQ